MYHIVNDKRAKVSARLIYEGLLECLKKKPFQKITIRDIQEASGVGRATFYRHFDSLADVLSAKCDQMFAELSRKLDEKYPNGTKEAFPPEYMQLVLSYLYDHWEIVETIVSVGRRDILYNSMLDYAKKRTKVYAPEMEESSTRFILISHIRVGILDSIINLWLEEGRKSRPEELIHCILDNEFLESIHLLKEGYH